MKRRRIIIWALLLVFIIGVSLGAALVYLPAGLIALGIACLIVAFLYSISE